MMSFISAAAQSESGESVKVNDPETMTKAEEPLLGVLDIVIIGGIVVILIYWLISKRKKPQIDVDANSISSLKLTPPTLKTGSISVDSSFISKMKHSGRNVVVFYGSQTGTAEEFAGRLAKDAVRYGMKGMIADLEECENEDFAKLAEIDNHLAIFCVATYGEGDPTDNAQEFHDWLKDEGDELSGVKYAVFALGNKTYEHYNAFGVLTDKRLEELGAERVFEIGKGDDDGNIEEDFVTWREQFWAAVCSYYGVQPIGDDVSIRQYTLAVHEPGSVPVEKIFTGEVARIKSYVNQRPPYDAKNPFLAPVTVNRELHTGGDRSCMHIELDITGSRIRYEAGDHVAIYPVNDSALVNRIQELLDIDLDIVISMNNVDEDSSKRYPFPCPTTYRTALSYYLDITHPPRTHVLKEMADYTENPEHKEFLKKLSAPTPEGKHLYREWILDSCRNIVSVLEDLPSVKPAIDHLCELLPRLQARYYSIASSPKVHPNSIHVTAILVDYITPTGRNNKGVATSWLKLKQPAGEELPKIPIYVRKSQFRLPFKTATPVIMIGPGTGLAPFRGFIQERDFYRSEGKPMGETILYTGCRNKAIDYIYADELEQYHKDESLTELNVAFSRDQAHKIYVTHLLKNNAEKLWKILNEQSGHIYVCGDARNMARDVNNLLVNLCEEYGGMNSDQSASFIKKLETKGRYSKDVWS